MTDELTGKLRVELYHRPTVPGSGSVCRVREALEDLHETGSVDLVDESVWPGEVPVPAGSGSESEPDAVEAYRRFADWADSHGVTVEPPFEQRERDSRLLGEGGAVLVTPAVCLAVRFDGTLLAVFPHTDDGETFSVGDGIDSLDEKKSIAVRGDQDETEPNRLLGRK